MISIQRILVPTDFSHNARYALEVAVDLAEKFEAQIFLLHVFEMPFVNTLSYQRLETPEIDESELCGLFKAETEDAMEALVRQFLGRKAPIKSLIIENGVPSVEIIRATKERSVDLIVMSAYSRMGISNLLIGGVTEKVVRKAPCPVLAVRNKGVNFECLDNPRGGEDAIWGFETPSMN